MSLTDSGLAIFHVLDKMRYEQDLECLELRWPETKDLKRRLYFLLHATTTGPAHSLDKKTTVDGYVAWLKLSREYDHTQGIDRSENQGTSEVVSSIMGDERG